MEIAERREGTMTSRTGLGAATYSLAEFAALLGLGYSAAWERAQRDELPVKGIRVGRQQKFPRSAVDALLGIDESHREAS